MSITDKYFALNVGYRGMSSLGQNGRSALNYAFFRENINIIIIPLGPFSCAKLKDILDTDPEL